MHKKLRDILLSNDTRKLDSYSADDLLDFQHDTYANIFLFAARKCNVKTIRAITKKLNKKQLKKLKHSEDQLGRSALMLASIANNIPMIQFLHEQLKLNLNLEINNKTALCFCISRNAHSAFNYLLLKGAKFTQIEKQATTDSNNKEFQDYYNSPICFLVVVQSQNKNAFLFSMRHIKTQSKKKQKKFTSLTDSMGRNALIIAARLNARTPHIKALMALDFDLEADDAKGRTVVYYLTRHDQLDFALSVINKVSNIPQSEIQGLTKKRDQLELDTQKSRNEWSKALSHSPSGSRQRGKVPRAAQTINSRPYRSFESDREVQLLKHAAAQLYFYLNEFDFKEDNLVEVQIMHLQYGNKHNLFIAVNEFMVSKYLPRLIKDMNNLQRLMSKKYKKHIRGNEGKLRSKRYANKLKHRLFGNDIRLPQSKDAQDQQQATHVANLLKNGVLHTLPIDLNEKNNKKTIRHCLSRKKNTIYLVVVKACKYKLRHAEEFLCDIADTAYHLAQEEGHENTKVYTCIAGKKRPCIGCSGRMKGRIDRYGGYPGLFWQHTLKHQSPEAAKNTLNILGNQQSNVSIGKNGQDKIEDFDSGSDTEDEITLNINQLSN